MSQDKLYAIERPFASSEQRALIDYQRSLETLASDRPHNLAADYDALGQGLLTDEQIKRLAAKSALEELRDKFKAGEVDRQKIIDLAELKRKQFEEIARQKSGIGQKQMAKAGEKGAFMTPETALGTPRQELAAKHKIPIGRTRMQIQERMVRDGVVPADVVPRFMSTPLQKKDEHGNVVMNFEDNPEIPEDLRDEFKSRMTKTYLGPEGRMESSGEGKSWFSDFANWLVDTSFVKALATGPELMNGYYAGYLEAMKESDIAKELREKGGKTFAGVPEEVLISRIGGGIESAMPVYGAIAPAGKLLAAAIDDPAKATRIAMANASAMLSGIEEGLIAGAGVWQDMGETQGIAKSLGRARAAYIQEARQYAREAAVPGETEADFEQRAENILQRLLKEDSASLAMEWPRTTEAIVTGISDPMNIAGGPLIKAVGHGVSRAHKYIRGLEHVGAPVRATEEGIKRFTDPLKAALVKGAYDSPAARKAGDAILDSMGEHGKAMKRIMMASQDAGSAVASKLISKFTLIDDVLAGIKKGEEAKFFDVVEAYGKSSRDSTTLKMEVAKHFGDTRRAGKVEKMVREYMPLVDEFYEISAKNGQLNDVRKVVDASGAVTGQAVFQASKIDGYIPYRIWDKIGNLGKAVNRFGFKDVDSAIIALEKITAQRLLSKAKDPKQVQYLKQKIAQFDDILKSKGVRADHVKNLAGTAGSAQMKKEANDLRAALYSMGQARNQVDILGQSKLHRVSPVSGAAKERLGAVPPIKDVRLQWRQHIQNETRKAVKSGEIKELAHGFGMKELAGTFTAKSLAKALDGGGTIKVMDVVDASKKTSMDDITLAVQKMGDELGVQYDLLSPELAKKFLQVTGTSFDPTKAVVAMPRAIGMRLEEVLPKIAPDAMNDKGFWQAIRVNFLQPTNEVFRASRTVNRSLAFQAVNMAGAVGIGFMTLGVRAMNPALQGGAARAAFNNALADSLGGVGPALGSAAGAVAAGGQAFQQDMSPTEIAAATFLGATGGYGAAKAVGAAGRLAATKVPKKYRAENVTVKVGDGEAKMADVLEQLNKYGLVGQSGHRYGSIPDISRAAPAEGIMGAYGRAAGYLSRVQQKAAAKTRMQQVAQFGDDYQKTIAFMGYLRKHGKVVNGKITQDSIYKAVDFTSEYAGNYSRLTKFEKTALRDTFAFYSWNRFILPVIVKHMFQNPQRLAAFEKLRNGLEGYVYDTTGEVIPSAGVPDWLKLSGATMAPEVFQPDVAPGSALSHVRAMGIMETPNAALSAFAPGFSGESPISAQFGPAGMAMAYMMNGFEAPIAARGRGGIRGGILPSVPTIMELAGNYDSPEQWMAAMFEGDDSFAFREAKNLIPFGTAFSDLSELYLRNGMYDEATEMHLRYRVGRDWMGLDHLAAKALGQTPLSIANYVPGYRLYPVDPVRVAARRKSRAMGILPEKQFE